MEEKWYAEMVSIKKKSGMTITQISELSGIPASTVAKILSGETPNPGINTINAIFYALRRTSEVLGTLEIRPGYGHCADLNKSKTLEAKEPSAKEYSAMSTACVIGGGNNTVEDYYNLPDGVRKELIDGRFYDLASPSIRHQRTIRDFLVQTVNRIKEKEGRCEPFIAPIAVQLDCDIRTMVEPDFIIVCDPKKIKEDCIYGAPDFVLEVLSPSTRSTDLTLKTEKYRHAGVREYWIADLKNDKLLIYYFEETDIPEIEPLNGMHEIRIYGGEIKVEL